jgi:arsenate reductase (glutaredoxin)
MTASNDVVIYHNPGCSTSRKVLAMLREAGIEPNIIEYLKTPPSRDMLRDLLARMQMPPRALLRRRGTPYEALGLDDPARSDDALIEAMVAEPILIERPIVVGPRGVRLCRPAELVYQVLLPR